MTQKMIKLYYGHVTNIHFADELTKTNKNPKKAKGLKFKYTEVDDKNQI